MPTKILEDTLNLKDVRIYDAIEDEEGRPKRVLNKTDTMLAQQKQQVIKMLSPTGSGKTPSGALHW